MCVCVFVRNVVVNGSIHEFFVYLCACAIYKNILYIFTVERHLMQQQIKIILPTVILMDVIALSRFPIGETELRFEIKPKGNPANWRHDIQQNDTEQNEALIREY
jgi:hypothetical protein